MNGISEDLALFFSLWIQLFVVFFCWVDCFLFWRCDEKRRPECVGDNQLEASDCGIQGGQSPGAQGLFT